MSDHRVVPDRDVFPGLLRCWIKAGRQARALSSVETIGGFGEKALAEQIRTDPECDILLPAAVAIAESGDPSVLRDLASQERVDNSYLLRQMQETARRSVVLDETALLEATFRKIASDQLHTVRPEIVSESGLSGHEVSAYLSSCVADIRADELASSVVRNGAKVVAPPRRRRGTSDLLHESLT